LDEVALPGGYGVDVGEDRGDCVEGGVVPRLAGADDGVVDPQLGEPCEVIEEAAQAAVRVVS
jgi:hypothetical protein